MYQVVKKVNKQVINQYFLVLNFSNFIAFFIKIKLTNQPKI